MKIELDHDEIGDAIALWLESKLIDNVTYHVNVTRADSLPRHGDDKPTKWRITATATQADKPDMTKHSAKAA